MTSIILNEEIVFGSHEMLYSTIFNLCCGIFRSSACEAFVHTVK